MSSTTQTPPAWHPFVAVFSAVGKVIADAREGKWFWFRHPNVHLKYINIRIDMRDGNCIVTDNTGQVISIDELFQQESTAGS